MTLSTVQKLMLAIAVVLVGFYLVRLMFPQAAVILGITNQSAYEVEDDSNITSLYVTPKGEVLGFWEYDNWNNGDEKIKSFGNFAVVYFNFDRELEIANPTDLIDVWQENCEGVLRFCIGGTSTEGEYKLLEKNKYSVAYEGGKSKVFVQVPGDQGAGDVGKDYIIRIRKEYIAGECGDNCKYLDEEKRQINPSTVMVKFQT